MFKAVVIQLDNQGHIFSHVQYFSNPDKAASDWSGIDNVAVGAYFGNGIRISRLSAPVFQMHSTDFIRQLPKCFDFILGMQNQVACVEATIKTGNVREEILQTFQCAVRRIQSIQWLHTDADVHGVAIINRVLHPVYNVFRRFHSWNDQDIICFEPDSFINQKSERLVGGIGRKINPGVKPSDSYSCSFQNGMNFIDVSPYYGHYKAETVLGKALREIPRDKYYLSTKVGRYGKDGVNTWDYSAKRATESVFESMKRLNVDYIDLINVHDIEFQAAMDGGLQKVVDETLPALVRLREKGVVGHVGITDLQPENLKWVVEHSEPGMVESILNFCHYSLNDTLLTDYLDFFEEHGVGVINASPLSMGLLSGRGAPDWHPAPASLKEACARAAAYCSEQGYPIEKLAVQFSTSLNPRIATTLFSSANPANVQRNIGYTDEPLDERLAAEVQTIIGNQMSVRWKNS